MNEEMRHEIVQRRQSGMTMRAIGEALGISRSAVEKHCMAVLKRLAERLS